MCQKLTEIKYIFYQLNTMNENKTEYKITDSRARVLSLQFQVWMQSQHINLSSIYERSHNRRGLKCVCVCVGFGVFVCCFKFYFWIFLLFSFSILALSTRKLVFSFIIFSYILTIMVNGQLIVMLGTKLRSHMRQMRSNHYRIKQ